MTLRNSGNLRRRTDGSADAGQVVLCVGLFFLLFLAVLLVSQFQLEQVRASDGYLQDALAASGLASALIDIQEYGKTHAVRIADSQAAYEQYCKSLRANLGLDESWECANRRLISGKVTVEAYMIYNVQDGQVTCCSIEGDRVKTSAGLLGAVYAPNGQLIEHTGIYSEISYPMKGLFGWTVQARKGKLVDIVGED